MVNYVVWGDQAPIGSIAAPPVEKQHAGWENEAPPAEWVNWHMNQTDSRLISLEEPWTLENAYSPGNTRPSDLLSGDRYAVPKYIVGADALRVYLDHVPCLENVHYQEVGLPGEESVWIRWLVDVPRDKAVNISAPVKVREKVGIVAESLTDIDVLLDGLVKRMANTVVEGHVSWTRLVSPGGTRAETIVAGTEYPVPAYTVGGDGLRVFLHGLICAPGATQQYMEVGEEGKESTVICWNDDIAPKYDILVCAPAKTSTTIQLMSGTTEDVRELLKQLENMQDMEVIHDKLTDMDERLDALESSGTPPISIDVTP